MYAFRWAKLVSFSLSSCRASLALSSLSPQAILSTHPSLPLINRLIKHAQPCLLYKFIMLKLNNLTLIISHPNTLYITNKQLKLMSGIQTAVTKNIGKVLSEGQIKWDDTIVLPYSNLLHFEITTKHQFGFNPEELEAVIQGKIKLTDRSIESEMKAITTNVFNLQGQKVGFLKADVRMSNKSQTNPNNKSQVINKSVQNIPPPSTAPPIQPAPTMKQYLQTSQIQSPQSPQEHQHTSQEIIRVTSIVAHINQIKGAKVQLLLRCGTKSTKTEEFTSKAGQLVYIGEYDLKREKMETQLIIEVHAISEGQTYPLTKALFMIDSASKIPRKAELRNDSGKQMGEMFIDAKIHIKDAKHKHIQSLISRQVDSTHSRYESQSQLMKSSSVTKKKISIMNSNHQIRFSKEKRFFGMLEDKKSDYVTYQAGNTYAFDFKDKKTNKFYRGASIGRGQKVDFIAEIKANPGVGEYRLPSIWDRY